MSHHPVVSRTEWLVARKELLSKEKAHTRQRDELAAERRRLPWVKVEKPYLFHGPDGPESLADLFGGRSQLIIYHFMFAPGWSEGCPSCSLHVDTIDGAAIHLAQRDVTLLVVSRAPLAEIEPFKRRMGWRFKWVSSYGSDFNYDFNVSFTPAQLARDEPGRVPGGGKAYYNYGLRDVDIEEMPGTSVFHKDADGSVYHTYSAFARGDETMMTTYMYLDIAPKGRDEDDLDFTMSWVRHHDRYEASPSSKDSLKGAGACCEAKSSQPRRASLW